MRIGAQQQQGGLESQLIAHANVLDFWVSDSGVTLTSGALSSWAGKKSSLTFVPRVSGGGGDLTRNAGDADFGGLDSFSLASGKTLKTSTTVNLTTSMLFLVVKTATAGYYIVHFDDGADGCYLYADTGFSSSIARSSVYSSKDVVGGGIWAGTTAAKTVCQRYAGTHASNSITMNGVALSLVNGSFTSSPNSALSGAIYIGSNSSGGGLTTGKVAGAAICNADDTALHDLVTSYFRSKFSHY